MAVTVTTLTREETQQSTSTLSVCSSFCNCTQGSLAPSSSIPAILLRSVSSFGNCSNPLGQVQVPVVTPNRTVAMVLPHEQPRLLLFSRFPPNNSHLTSPDSSLQLCIWVLIVSQHGLYVNYEVLGALSPVGLRFGIWAIFIDSLLKSCILGVIVSVIS